MHTICEHCNKRVKVTKDAKCPICGQEIANSLEFQGVVKKVDIIREARKFERNIKLLYIILGIIGGIIESVILYRTFSGMRLFEINEANTAKITLTLMVMSLIVSVLISLILYLITFFKNKNIMLHIYGAVIFAFISNIFSLIVLMMTLAYYK